MTADGSNPLALMMPPDCPVGNIQDVIVRAAYHCDAIQRPSEPRLSG